MEVRVHPEGNPVGALLDRRNWAVVAGAFWCSPQLARAVPLFGIPSALLEQRHDEQDGAQRQHHLEPHPQGGQPQSGDVSQGRRTRSLRSTLTYSERHRSADQVRLFRVGRDTRVQ